MCYFWYVKVIYCRDVVELVDKFGADNIHLIFTDTDSLYFELTGKDYKEQYLIYHTSKMTQNLLHYLTAMSLMSLDSTRRQS